jgi:hypothetical protein
MGYVLFSISYLDIIVLNRKCLKWKQFSGSLRWQLTNHCIFNTIEMHGPIALQGIMEPPFSISQFKVFSDLAIHFSDPKSIISLLYYLQLRLSSVQCSSPLLTKLHLKWGVHHTLFYDGSGHVLSLSCGTTSLSEQTIIQILQLHIIYTAKSHYSILQLKLTHTLLIPNKNCIHERKTFLF